MSETWLQSPTIQRLHKKSADALSKWALNHQFAVLLGSRHSGKTHILQTAIQAVAARKGWGAVLFSLDELQGSASTTEEFFGEVLLRLQEKLIKYHPALAAYDRSQSEDNRISSALFCARVNSIVEEMGKDLYIAFDHLETLPDFFANELLQALRTFSSKRADVARVVTIVASTLPITNLNTGVVSPYFNIAEQLYVGDLSEQDNRAIAEELIPDADEEFRADLLHNAQGDLELLTWICKACVEKAKEDERERPPHYHLPEAVRDFFALEARTHPVFEEAQKQIATNPRLLSCMADLVGDAKIDVRDSETETALRLTGLVLRNEGGSYSLRNEIYRKYLRTYYSSEMLGRLFAAIGDWERGTDLLIKHYAAHMNTDDAQPMLDFAITAAFVAVSLEEAVHRLTRVLEKAFPVRNARFWLQTANGASLRCIYSSKAAVPMEDEISQKASRPEARAWRTGNILTFDSGEQVAFPLITHSRRTIGVVTLEHWRKIMQTSDRPRLINDLRDFLYKAARPLSHLIELQEQETERALRERELPRLIATISRLENVDAIPQEALRLLSESCVLPFRGAAIQLLSAQRDCLEVRAFTENGEVRTPNIAFSVPSYRGKIVKGYLNVSVLKEEKPRTWESRSNTPLYVTQAGYVTWPVTHWMGVPLTAKKETLGVLTLYGDPGCPVYSDKHKGLASQIADSIAGRIYEVRQSKRKQQERELLREITGSMQDLDETRKNVLKGTMELTGAEAGDIGLVDMAKGQITIPVALVKNRDGAVETKNADQLRAYRFSTELDSGTQSIMTYVTAHRHSVNISDVGVGKWKRIYKPLHANTLSELAVPIFDPNDVVVGIINLESPRPNAFRKEDCDLLEELRMHVYSAVHNARIYDRLWAASLRSAVTAIMARNMSHNIGSHSLSYLSSKETLSRLISADTGHSGQTEAFTARLNPDELTANLNGYIRERMDFIASIPTLNPTWTMPLDLMEAVFSPVWGEEGCAAPPLFLLLNTIARSERIYAPALRLNVCIRDDRYPDAQETFTYGYEYRENDLVYCAPDPGKATKLSRKIAVFMGTTGLQALYGLMENFIRNSAKHSSETHLERVRLQNTPDARKANPAKALNVTLEFTYNCGARIDRALNDLVRLRIYDNMCGWTEDTETKINANIDRFLNQDGRLVEGFWGLKEMRICASFLRGLTIPEYNSNHDPPILQAEAHAMEGKGRSLGYVLYLPRVKECLILGSVSYPKREGAADDWVNQGVYTVDSLEELEELTRLGSFNHASVLIGLAEEPRVQKRGVPQATTAFAKEFLRHPTHFPVKTLLVAPQTGLPECAPPTEPTSNVWDNAVCCIDENRLVQALFPSQPPGEAGAVSVTDWQALQPGEQAIAMVRAAWLQKQMGLTAFPRIQIVHEMNSFYTSDSWVNHPIEPLPDLNGTIVFNHGWYSLRKQPDLLPSCRFYASYRSSPPSAVTGLVETMSRQAGNYDFERLSAYQELLEAALTNIIVIDERIFSDSLDRRHIQGADAVLLNRYLMLQNIAVFNIPQKSKMAGIARSEPLKNEKRPTPTVRRFALSELAASLPDFAPAHFASQVHFLVLHHTILQNKLGGHENLERFLDKMGVYRPRWVVITSGRGRPETVTMPSEARFLEYSNLRRFTIQDTDKVLLSRMLWSLKDGKDG